MMSNMSSDQHQIYPDSSSNLFGEEYKNIDEIDQHMIIYFEPEERKCNSRI